MIKRGVGAVRSELGLIDRQPLIVSVGRLHPQKSHDVLIRASAGWSGSRVVIAGDGPSEATLRELIATEHAPVTLLGRRDDVGDLLAAADVVVLASAWEARSLAAQEALLLGRPLVATAVGGMRALVGDGGVLVPAGDVAALTTAVRALIDAPERRAELSELARRQASTWGTAIDTVTRVEAVYDELLGR